MVMNRYGLPKSPPENFTSHLFQVCLVRARSSHPLGCFAAYRIISRLLGSQPAPLVCVPVSSFKFPSSLSPSLLTFSGLKSPVSGFPSHLHPYRKFS